VGSKDTPPAPLKRGGSLGDLGKDEMDQDSEIWWVQKTHPRPLSRGEARSEIWVKMRLIGIRRYGGFKRHTPGPSQEGRLARRFG